MSGFVVLAWPPESAEASARAEMLSEDLSADDRWRPAAAASGLAVWARAGGRLPVRWLSGARGVLIGDLHPRPGTVRAPEAFLDELLAAEPETACRRLTAGAWGSYVAVFGHGAGAARAYRDPSAAIEALAWRRGGVEVVASGLEDLPPGLWPDRLALDWGAIARLLRAPGRSALESPLEGVRPLAAGVLQPLADAGSGPTIWSPVSFLAEGPIAPGEAAAALRACVDAVTASQCAMHERLLVELSGGLDSAVVGGALVAAGLGGRGVAWLNYFDGRPEGDERPYARAVAAGLGVPLTEVPLTVDPLEPGDLADLARGVRPPVTALGRRHDRDVAARARAAGAGAVLTGQGGDAAFFQMPSPLILADALRRNGAAALRSGLAGDLARWSRKSAWAVLAEARRGLRRPAPLPIPPALPGLSPDVIPLEHPWVTAAAGAPPAKRLHVASLAAAPLYAGDSCRRRAAEILRPLYAQPVLELVLSIPAEVLAAGGRDRALARQAFADRLPGAVRARRGKGSLGPYYADVVLASLDWLRPHLLDGVLCDSGLVDRGALAAALTPESIAWRGGANSLLVAALTESWVRHWQGRAPDSARFPRRAPPRPAMA